MSRAAITHLQRIDPILAGVIEQVGPYRLKLRTEGTHFAFVARAIVYQQLSGKAAATIHTRFQSLFTSGHPEPRSLLAVSDDALRGAGLSRQKIGYLRDLAARCDRGEIPIESVQKLSDDEVIAALTAIKGVGKWTAQMFLIFRLGRPDVLPDGDLGIQKAIMRAYRMRKMPSPERVRKVGARWAPYRSVASWYLWRSLDTEAAI
jgi:3-methyladenine DNA glycosylase/8-oxoguanine DNA glycosylase